MKLTETDKRLIYLLQSDLPVSQRPFAWLAQRVGLDEEKVIARVAAFKESGLIRRFGATLFHQRSGYPANVMVAWRAPAERIEEMGQHLAAFREVTHCYQRASAPTWPYNLYTMTHGQTEAACLRIVERMAKKVGLDDYRLLYSLQELKKTSMRYFA